MDSVEMSFQLRTTLSIALKDKQRGTRFVRGFPGRMSKVFTELWVLFKPKA